MKTKKLMEGVEVLALAYAWGIFGLFSLSLGALLAGRFFGDPAFGNIPLRLLRSVASHHPAILWILGTVAVAAFLYLAASFRRRVLDFCEIGSLVLQFLLVFGSMVWLAFIVRFFMVGAGLSTIPSATLTPDTLSSVHPFITKGSFVVPLMSVPLVFLWVGYAFFVSLCKEDEMEERKRIEKQEKEKGCR